MRRVVDKTGRRIGLADRGSSMMLYFILRDEKNIQRRTSNAEQRTKREYYDSKAYPIKYLNWRMGEGIIAVTYER